MQRDKAFSGLEAGIILIAFIVVAAVFSYAILGAGFFTAQKAETVIESSSKEASAVMYSEGSIYGELYDSGPYTGQLKTATFTMTIPDSGLAQDLRGNIIIYTQYDKAGHTVFSPRTYTFGDIATATEYSVTTKTLASPLMYPKDKLQFTLTELAGPLPGGYFTIETKPSNGVGAFLQKYIPSGYNGGIIL